MRRLHGVFAFAPLLALGCSSSNGVTAGNRDAGADAGHDARSDRATREAGRPESGPPDSGCGTVARVGDAPTSSGIKHLVVVIQENHSFDNYFSRYCTARTGSNPTCHAGPSCCETGPAKDPGTGDAPVDLTDTVNAKDDPDHDQDCELSEINGGKMDGYVNSSLCGESYNFSYADKTTAKAYWDLAGSSALADRYFQSVAGASTSNDFYLATARFVFKDDAYEPVAKGASCQSSTQMSFMDPTIADLMVKANVPWGWYGEGYDAALAAAKTGMCPGNPACPAGPSFNFYPCTYDPGDDPFLYFTEFTDNAKYIFDFSRFACDLAGDGLPAVSYVKAIGYETEHPGLGDTISAGEAFVTSVIDAVSASSYASDTLILVTWDESGGFFDHVAPPPTSSVDGQPYGPRIPLLAIGPFAKKNYISHVQVEHSSIVKFIEWNWLGKKTGQLAARDAVVNNLGDLLDPKRTGVTVPSD